VNRYTASASEIVSACLQDHHRAVIMGERTWGKGSVQNVIPLENGQSALKLTTASYHRPSGKNIHRFPDASDEDDWGVTPDAGYEVKLSPGDTVALLINRRDRDIVRPRPPLGMKPPGVPVGKKAAASRKPPSEKADAPPPADVLQATDRALRMAVDHLSSALVKAD
jgi:carboxyl-terminal processing protease